MPRGAVLQSWGDGHDSEAMPSSVDLDNFIEPQAPAARAAERSLPTQR